MPVGQPAEGRRPVERPEQARRRRLARGPGQGLQARGEPRLRPRERREREQPPAARSLGVRGRVVPRRRHDLARAEERVERVEDCRRLRTQQVRRRGDEFPLGQQCMALVPRRAEGVQRARLEARGRVRRDADRLGDLVGRLEADAPDLARQPVGLLAHHPPAVIPEALVDAHGEGRGHAVALERRHHLADVALLLPGSGDAARAHRADARHLGQPLGRGVDHLEGRLAEGVDDAPGVDRADPLHQPAPQVAAHPLGGGREGGAVVERLELPAVLGTILPPAVRDDRLARGEVGQRADQRDQAVVAPRRLDLALPRRALGGEPGDGVTVLRVLVGDALHHPAQLLARRCLPGALLARHRLHRRRSSTPRMIVHATPALAAPKSLFPPDEAFSGPRLSSTARAIAPGSHRVQTASRRA